VRRSWASWFGVLAGVVVLVVLLSWWWMRPKPLVVPLATAREIVSGGNRTLLNASGYVTARRDATVSSKVTGLVMEILVEEGMRVIAGQVLARLDASNIEASLRLAEARSASVRTAVGETRASLELAERELERVRRLSAAKVVSESEIDRASAEASVLRARLERQSAEIVVAEREAAVWRQQFEDTVIRAPFDGIVTSKNAQPGEIISPMSAGGGFTRTGICTIVDMGSLEVEVDVNESYINRVTPGQPVVATLDSYPDWPIPAKVIAIIPTADRQKATVRVRVGFDALDPRILPDMSLKVAFQSTESGAAPKRAVALPREAVRRIDGRDIVWVVRDGTVERRAVTVEDTRGEEVTLAAGLAAGETVVLAGPAELADGMRVSGTPD
jgi:RND family efflux transporter MFP subunit